ncbi:MAG: OB-fold nucleic acid binding domain-containing protein, partial [Candidatus Krumholzibacteriia bacterium]
MQSAEIAAIGKHVGSEVLLKGWVYNIRSSGKIIFLLVRDGTGVIQCVIEKSSAGEELFAKAAAL